MQKVKFFLISIVSFAILSHLLFIVFVAVLIKGLLLLLGIPSGENLGEAGLMFFAGGLGAGVLGWVAGVLIGLFVSIKLSKKFKLQWYWGLIALAVYIALFAIVLFFLPSVRPVKAEVIENLRIQNNQLTFGTWSSSESPAISSPSTPSNSSTPPSVDLKKQIIDQVVTAIQSQDATTLYSLMSADFRGVFTEENLASSLTGGEKIVSVAYLETPQTLPEGWAEQQAIFTTASGVEKTFNLILKLEDSVWKLAATEEI